MSCPLSWLANNSTELPGLCHFQGSPQQLALAYLDLRKKRQHGISGLGAEQGLLMGGIDHRHAEDRDVPVFGHQPWERPHFYSHADTLETRNEVHPTLLTLKYRWIKKRTFSLPIYCVHIYREDERRLSLQSLLWVRWVEPLWQNLLHAARGATCTTSQLLCAKIRLTRPQQVQLAPTDQPL